MDLEFNNLFTGEFPGKSNENKFSIKNESNVDETNTGER